MLALTVIGIQDGTLMIKTLASLLHEDIKIREFLYAKLKGAYVANIEIERSKNRVSIYVHTSRPGVVIGKDGEAVDCIKKRSCKNG